MNKIAVFIDRDGTINEEVGYIDHSDRFRLLPMVAEAIRKLNQNDILAIMVTNQSGVARGYFPMELLDALHGNMTEEFEKRGCHLDGIYICTHHPDDHCACRKPRPGMLLRASREKGITLHNSYIVGDKLTDIKLAHRVGAKGILVLTGYGAEEIRGMGGLEDKPDHVAANLYEAVDWILGQVAGSSEEVAGVTPTPSLPCLPYQKGGGRKGRGSTSPATCYPLPVTSKSRRILIVKPSSLGDIVHSLPVLWLLRKIYPDAHIGWVVKEAWKEMLVGNPLLDEVIVLKKGLKGLSSAIRDVRKRRYDTIIDLQGLFRSGIISLLSSAHERIGFSNAREFAYMFYNKKINVLHKPMHAVDRYLLALSQCHPNPCFSIPCHPELVSGSQNPEEILKQVQNDKPYFPLYTNIEDSEWAREFLLENRLYNTSPIVAINPSARWGKKRWPVRSYADLINRLIREIKAGIIILGSEGDIPIAEEVSSLVQDRITIATGKTSLKTLTALLEQVDLLVTNDSGPMHIAAALGKPVVALFGPTDPRLTGPYGEGHTVIRKDMDCSPCLRRPCRHGRPICMEAITVEEVVGVVKSVLANR